jgi:acyl-CoA thioester hydrolase
MTEESIWPNDNWLDLSVRINQIYSIELLTSEKMHQLLPVFLGSVNRWECDENDHLNVRFYAQKMHQTLAAGLLDLALVTPEALDTTLQSLTAQHMRYLAEARVAAPLTGVIGLLETTDSSFTVLTELRNTQSGKVQASFTQTFATVLAQPPTYRHKLPDHAGSRGLTYRNSPYAHLTLDEAYERGFTTIGRGVIQGASVHSTVDCYLTCTLAESQTQWPTCGLSSPTRLNLRYAVKEMKAAQFWNIV